MMMLALPVATMPIVATGDVDVIIAHRYCARSKTKRRASSLNWNADTLRRGIHLAEESIRWRSPMASNENRRKYVNEEEEESAEVSTIASKK
jgi:hypothetical protein